MADIQKINEVLAARGFSLAAVFVPFSQSRSKAEKTPSLNWRVTLRMGDREVITTDYMQGCGHCPAYKAPATFATGKRDEYTTRQRIAKECETGRATREMVNCGVILSGAPIPPPAVHEVLWSLLMDAHAIDAGGFADWCAEYGYSDDSISARATYDACLDIALKLRGAVGDDGLRTLNELFEGY